MIQNSFVFLDGVGSRLEKTLWDGGIRTWDSFLDKENIKGISRHRKLYYNRKIMEARRALYSYDLQYFLHNLPKAEMWRLYEFFKDEAVFIDIETDGLSGRSDITVFGLYDGINSKTMIRGVNLNYNALKEELKKYKLFVTFNGAAFDIPFIEKRYPGLLPKIPNFDVK